MTDFIPMYSGSVGGSVRVYAETEPRCGDHDSQRKIPRSGGRGRRHLCARDRGAGRLSGVEDEHHERQYKGKTSNGLVVTFRIQSGKVRNFSATVHALCITVAGGSSYLDPQLHQITPPPMKLAANGKFSGEYVPHTASTHGKIDGKVAGNSASGHYRISYTALSGMNIYACQEQGTWKATRR